LSGGQTGAPFVRFGSVSDTHKAHRPAPWRRGGQTRRCRVNLAISSTLTPSQALMPPVLDQSEAAIARRVMVATDRSETADNAVRWAASFAERCSAELCLVQVVVPRETTIDRGRRSRARACRDGSWRARRNRGQAVRSARAALVVVDKDPAGRSCVAAEQEGKRRPRSRATSACRGVRNSFYVTYPTASATGRAAR